MAEEIDLRVIAKTTGIRRTPAGPRQLGRSLLQPPQSATEVIGVSDRSIRPRRFPEIPEQGGFSREIQGSGGQPNLRPACPPGLHLPQRPVPNSMRNQSSIALTELPALGSAGAWFGKLIYADWSTVMLPHESIFAESAKAPRSGRSFLHDDLNGDPLVMLTRWGLMIIQEMVSRLRHRWHISSVQVGHSH
jgi:hypothetical protein